MKKIICFLAIIISLYSCQREHSCNNDTLKLNFIGYTGADIDTIIIRRFATNTNFGQLADTVLFVIDSTGVLHNNDTTSLHGNYPDNVIKYGNDWQIVLPSAHKTVSISNIISPQKEGHCSAPGKVECICLNLVQSYVQDGATVVPDAASVLYTGYKIFIHK